MTTPTEWQDLLKKAQQLDAALKALMAKTPERIFEQHCLETARRHLAQAIGGFADRAAPQAADVLSSLLQQFDSERAAELDGEADWRRRVATPPVGQVASDDAVPF
jgi:hypothetical protein